MDPLFSQIWYSVNIHLKLEVIFFLQDECQEDKMSRILLFRDHLKNCKYLQ